MIGLSPRYRKLERFAITCPLGVRFRDSATRTMVSDGLHVEAYSPGDAYNWDPQRRLSGVANRSGVFAFHHLPGLRDFEYGMDDEQRWSGAPLPRSLAVEVTDGFGRFIPVRFAVTVPERASSPPAASSSPPQSAMRTVDLYSAPTRPTPSGCAVVRADLVERDSHKPAAWVMVEVHTQIRSHLVRARGVTDQGGHLALIFPFPEAVDLLPSPLSGLRSLMEQSWTLGFRAWHLFDAEPGDAADLDGLLALVDRPAADSLWIASSPPQPFATAELCFGRELVVPATGLGDSRQLLIGPAGSPP